MAVAALLVPATAWAKHKTFGSDLKADASVELAQPVDTAYWNVGLPIKQGAKAPAKGSISTIRVKGTAVRHGPRPDTTIHFQVLHPIGHGKVKITLTSGAFNVPVGGDPNQVTSYHPVNLCVHKGDYVALNVIGGYEANHYPSGTPFRIFAPLSGAAMRSYTKINGTNNGDRFKGKRTAGQELLMQTVLATKKDAAYPCRH